MRARWVVGIVSPVVFFLVVCGAATGAAATRKVLIIGIDGCRPDALLVARAPTIEALWKNGAYSFHAATDAITLSGPGWTSMLTGVWHKKHGIENNNLSASSRPRSPHLFHLVKKSSSGLFTASIVQWAPLQTILRPGDANVRATAKTDEAVARKAAAVLTKKDPAILFVQFDAVDQAGHTYGFAPHLSGYVQAIEATDSLVEQVLNALRGRRHFREEEWLILLSSDHGGTAKGHGGKTAEENNVFFIAYGPSVMRGEIQPSPGIVDVAATALTYLGIGIEEKWGLDGHAVGIRSAPTRRPDNTREQSH